MTSENRRMTTVSVIVTRKVGADTVEHRAIGVAPHGSELQEFDYLNGVINEASRQWLNTYAAGRPAGAGDQPGGDTGTWYKVERVGVSTADGKRYVRVYCGRWQKHGIVVWPEVFERAGINAAVIPDAGLTPESWHACIVEPEGKAARCINITHSQDSRKLVTE